MKNFILLQYIHSCTIAKVELNIFAQNKRMSEWEQEHKSLSFRVHVCVSVYVCMYLHMYVHMYMSIHVNLHVAEKETMN